MIHSVNCRLPQTPRTPSTAAAHYFDDIFKRPTKPSRLRRSSTTRSIGARSDWADENGDDDEEENGFSSAKRINSVGYLDEEALKKKAEIDEKVAHYVSDQLERVRSQDSASHMQDELEAQLDEP